jgi:hypothetical protein
MKSCIVYIKDDQGALDSKIKADFPIKEIHPSQSISYLKAHAKDIRIVLVDDQTKLGNKARLLSFISHHFPGISIINFSRKNRIGLKGLMKGVDGFLFQGEPQEYITHYLNNFARAIGVN